jgi:hypothetical protein
VQALANQRSYLNLQRLLASRPSRGQTINMHLRARIKHSLIYTCNKWTLNLQAAPLGDYQHHTRLPHWRPMSIERAPHQRALQAYLTGSIANRSSKLPQRSPTRMQCVPHATGAFRKEDLRPSSVSPTQWARFKSTSVVRRKWPFSGPTAAGVCPRKDSREQWC